MIDCLVVGLGGCIGSILRYLIGKIPVETNGFPIHTLGINVIGCFLISLIVSLATKNTQMDPRLVLFFKTGVCGGFTTFSTFSLETQQLMQTGQYTMAIIYVLCSILLGIFAIFAAQWILK